MEEIKNEYDKILSNINQTVSDLANATEPQDRAAHYARLRSLEGDKDRIEKDTSTRDAQEFNHIRKNNKKMRLNEYAETVERRGEDFGGVRRYFTDQQANSRSAAAIRKEKSDVQKLADLIANPPKPESEDNN